MNIYYLMAQLPFLRFGEKPSISQKYFLEQARFCLNNHEFSLLIKSTIDNYSWQVAKHPFFKSYAKFEYELLNEIYLYRKSAQEGSEYKTPQFLQEVFGAANPLDAEKKLLQIKWRYIEQDEYRHLFTFNAAIIYFLKLQILERFFTFDKTQGLKQFDALCEVNI